MEHSRASVVRAISIVIFFVNFLNLCSSFVQNLGPNEQIVFTVYDAPPADSADSPRRLGVARLSRSQLTEGLFHLKIVLNIPRSAGNRNLASGVF